MTRVKRKIWHIVGVAVILAVTAITLSFGVVYSMNHVEENLTTSQGQARETSGVRLSIAPARNADTNGNAYTQTLTATVLPADAPNKLVDWSVVWADDAALKNSDISEYLTVTPESDGSTTATITCKKKFTGSSAYVKCVTRVGKFEATALVKYDNVPLTTYIDRSSLSSANLNNSPTILAVPVSGATLPLKFSNPLDDDITVSASDITVTTAGVGEILTGTYTNDAWTTTESYVSLNTIKDSIFTVTYDSSSKSLLVNVSKTVENYYENVNYGSGYTSYIKKFKNFRSMSGGVHPYFTITVSYTNQKGKVLTDTIDILPVSSVSRISLSQSTISF